MLSVLVDLLLYAAGALVVTLAVRAWRRELSVWALAGYALAAALYVGPALLTPRFQVPTDIAYQVGPWSPMLDEPLRVRNGLLQDPILQMLPFRTLVRESWLDGDLPLWSHELATGQPLLGNGQSAALAPFHLMALPVPPLRGMTLAVAWQLLLGLLLTHALVRRVAHGPQPSDAPPLRWPAGAGAVVGALAYAFSTFSFAWAYFPMGMSAMWIPGVLLGLLSLADGERRAFAGLVLCAVGLALSGHPETLAHTGLAAAAVTLALLVRWRSPVSQERLGELRKTTRELATLKQARASSVAPRNAGRFLLRLAAAAIVSFALASPFLLPVLEAADHSQRMVSLREDGDEPEGINKGSFHPDLLLPAVSPLVWGSPREGNWNGPGNFNEMCGQYAGLLPLALALAGAVVFRGRLLAMLAGGALGLATATWVRPFIDLMVALPLIGHGAHARLRLMWILAVAVAGGVALEWLTRREPPAGRDTRLWIRRWQVLAVVLAAVALCAAALPAADADWQRLTWVTALGGALAALVVLAVSRPGNRRRRALAATAIVATAAELTLLGIRYNPAVPAELDLAPPPAVAFLQQELAEEGPFRILGEGYTLAANLSAVYGLWDPRGNDPMTPGEAARFISLRLAGGYRPGHAPAETADSYDEAFHDFLGIRWVMVQRGRRLLSPWRQGPRKGGMWLWENRRTLPLFYVPERVEAAADARQALTRALAIEDFAALAVAEQPFRGRQRGDAEVTAVDGNGFSLALSSPAGGLVASSVSWAPGWRVTTPAGRELETHRVNGAFLGFEAPPGEVEVEVRYVPVTWWPAWGLFAAALAGWGGVVVVSRRGGGRGSRRRWLRGPGRRRRSAAAPPSAAPPSRRESAGG